MERKAATMRGVTLASKRAAGTTVLVILGALVLAGCATEVVRMRHPATRHAVACERTVCSGFGCYEVQQRHLSCVEDYRYRGYERVIE
jgi:hypothetical protein